LYLHGGDETKWAADPTPLAKSGRLYGQNRAADRAARRKARWPKGARHEALSVRLVEQTASAQEGINDSELLKYILGSHHGRGRPVWPVELNDDLPKDTDPMSDTPSEVTCRLGDFSLKTGGLFRPESVLTRLDAGWTDLFWRLIRRYGYWGLAFLETLLILADHQQSQAEIQR
jgi:CRISPR-associated endonuclease/helicase Cas3